MKSWLYFLMEFDGRVRQIVNGLVQSLNKKTPLRNHPIGWEEIAIAWDRNLEWYGTVQNFSTPLSFVGDGRKIIRHDLYSMNPDRRLYVIIAKQESSIDETHFKDYYKTYYKGLLDFSTAIDKPQAEKAIEIQVAQEGLQRDIEANKATKYETPLEGNSYLRMDGLTFAISKKNLILEGVDVADPTYNLGNHFVDILGVSDETSLKLSTKDVSRRRYSFVNTEQLAGQPDWFINPSTDCFFEFTYKFRISATIIFNDEFPPGTPITPGQTFIGLRIVRNGVALGMGSDGFIMFQGILNADTNPNIIEGNGTLRLLKGDLVYFITAYTAIGSNGDRRIDYQYHDIDGNNFNFKARYKFSTTSIPVIKPFDLYKSLIKQCAGSEDYAVSTLLQNTNYVFTSGDGIRSLASAVIKTSLTDFFTNINVQECAGMEVKDKVYLEHRSYFFDDNKTPIELGEVTELDIRPNTEVTGSTINIGWQEQDIEDLNGKFDFNGLNVYETPIKVGEPKAIELQSPYSASPFEIEIIRVNLEGQTTTDNSRDNKVYVIAVKDPRPPLTGLSVDYVRDPDFVSSFFRIIDGAQYEDIFTGSRIRIDEPVFGGDYEVTSTTVEGLNLRLGVRNPPFTDSASAGGVTIEFTTLELDRSIPITSDFPDPATVFNVPLSPKRMLQKHYPWLSGVFHNYNGEELKFISASKSKDMVAGGVEEGANVPVNAFGPKMFIPFDFTFKTAVPFNLYEVLNQDSNMPFSFVHEDRQYKGFLRKAGISAETKEEQELRLISSPSNNMEELIYG